MMPVRQNLYCIRRIDCLISLNNKITLNILKKKTESNYTLSNSFCFSLKLDDVFYCFRKIKQSIFNYRLLLFLMSLPFINHAGIIEYHRAVMVDISIYENGLRYKDKIATIVNAFKETDDKEAACAFFHKEYHDFIANEEKYENITDTTKLLELVAQSLWFDLDNDGEREIVFHVNRDNPPLTIIFRKQTGKFKIVFKEYGYICNLVFTGKPLRSIVLCEYHNEENPFDKIKVWDFKSEGKQMIITPVYKLNVPKDYHYPVKIIRDTKPIRFTAKEIYFYYKVLYTELNYPYNSEIKWMFNQLKYFNVLDSDWEHYTNASVREILFMESRGQFTSVLISVNSSFATDFPEYIMLYLPNEVLDLELVR